MQGGRAQEPPGRRGAEWPWTPRSAAWTACLLGVDVGAASRETDTPPRGRLPPLRCRRCLHRSSTHLPLSASHSPLASHTAKPHSSPCPTPLGCATSCSAWRCSLPQPPPRPAAVPGAGVCWSHHAAAHATRPAAASPCRGAALGVGARAGRRPAHDRRRLDRPASPLSTPLWQLPCLLWVLPGARYLLPLFQFHSGRHPWLVPAAVVVRSGSPGALLLRRLVLRRLLPAAGCSVSCASVLPTRAAVPPHLPPPVPAGLRRPGRTLLPALQRPGQPALHVRRRGPRVPRRCPRL